MSRFEYCDSCGNDLYECNCEDCPECGERISAYDYDVQTRTSYFECSCGYEWESKR